MKSRLTVLSIILLEATTVTYSQRAKTDSTFRRYFIGTSGFVLLNLEPNQVNPPSFYQLNVGRWLTKRDVISIEAKTWIYRFPLGIPFGDSFQAPSEKNPGKVTGYGIGVASQRFLWKGLYSAVHVALFLQEYFDIKNEKIKNGFQLFTVLRVGYHLELFQNRFFIEPSLAFSYWPVNTNVPEAFAKLESKWSNYFLFEPGHHFSAISFNFSR